MLNNPCTFSPERCPTTPCRLDHVPYLEAVGRALEARGVLVLAIVSGTGSDGRREATVTMRPGRTAFPSFPFFEPVASWNEEDGWSLVANREPAESPAYKGLEVVPAPDDVAAWVVVLLAHPEVTPSREEHPFRDHSVPDPGFEAELARYAAGGERWIDRARS